LAVADFLPQSLQCACVAVTTAATMARVVDWSCCEGRRHVVPLHFGMCGCHCVLNCFQHGWSKSSVVRLSTAGSRGICWCPKQWRSLLLGSDIEPCWSSQGLLTKEMATSPCCVPRYLLFRCCRMWRRGWRRYRRRPTKDRTALHAKAGCSKPLFREVLTHACLLAWRRATDSKQRRCHCRCSAAKD